jgi:urea transport system permease protein
MLNLFNAIFNGISIGSVLLIAALGLAIVFGLMGVINLAHGELMMLGAYSTFVVQNVFKPLGDPLFSTYIFFALPVAFIVAAIAGLILERGVIRFLYGRPLETLLATWGVSLILRQFVRSVNWVLVIGILIFSLLFFGAYIFLKRSPDRDRIKTWFLGLLFLISTGIATTSGILISQLAGTALTRPWFSARNVDVTAPEWLRGGIQIGTIQFPYSRIFIIILTVICLFGIYWFLNRSDWGLKSVL